MCYLNSIKLRFNRFPLQQKPESTVMAYNALLKIMSDM